MSYRVGAARADITPSLAVGMAMAGWGNPGHRVKGVATPLHARAISIFEPIEKKRLIMVCLEIAYITEALRTEVVARSGLRDEELILSATHTHSAPGGYSSFLLYELTSGGFMPYVFETYVSGAVKAIQEAMKSEVPAQIRFAAGKFADKIPVAFNRSVRAFNSNTDVKRVSRAERYLSVDREMTLLRFDREDGAAIASWNWFAVHATSVHKNNFKIHSDNKGVAAAKMERELEKRGEKGFVSVFAQGATGDVSPNFRRYFGLIDKRGARRDDERSCQINAHYQRKQATKLFDEAQKNEPLPVKLDGIFEFHNMSTVEVEPDLAEGQSGLRTGPAELGLSMFRGTAEGGGAVYPILLLVKVAVRLAQIFNYVLDRIAMKSPRWPWALHPVQWNKLTVVASGRSEIFETSRIDKLAFPDWIDPAIKNLRRFAKNGILKGRPFTPQILPLQLAQIGNLVIAAIPAEFTTVAGWRLRKTIETAFEDQKVHRSILQCYANAYSGYVVTPEEYLRQGYEGGCTHFGRWTLPAYLTRFRSLCKKMISKEAVSELRPVPVTPEYLKAFEYRK